VCAPRRVSGKDRDRGDAAKSFEKRSRRRKAVHQRRLFRIGASVLDLRFDGPPYGMGKTSPWKVLPRGVQLNSWIHRGFWQPDGTLARTTAPERSVGSRRGALETMGKLTRNDGRDGPQDARPAAGRAGQSPWPTLGLQPARRTRFLASLTDSAHESAIRCCAKVLRVLPKAGLFRFGL